MGKCNSGNWSQKICYFFVRTYVRIKKTLSLLVDDRYTSQKRIFVVTDKLAIQRYCFKGFMYFGDIGGC